MQQRMWRIIVIATIVSCSGQPSPRPAEPHASVAVDAAQPIDADPLDQPLDLGDPWLGDTSQAFKKMVSFAEQMCACRDPACADRVNGKMTVWAKEMKDKAAPPSSPSTHPQAPPDKGISPELMDKMKKVGQRYAECMTRALEG